MNDAWWRRMTQGLMKLGVVTSVLLGATTATLAAEPTDMVGARRLREGTEASFVTSMSIRVPSFHGVEPSLSLDYDSSRSQGGEAGVGWGLSGGATYIERTSAERGTPRYDATDLFLMGGSAQGELTPCTTTTSGGASCTAGGNYTERYESFRRVRFDSASNTWFVTFKDGKEARFGAQGASRLDTSGGTFRWYLDELRDARSTPNIATYTYLADAAPCGALNLSQLAYGNVTVSFTYAARPDPEKLSAGKCVVHRDKRLTLVDVKVAGVRARAYSIAYAQSLITARSLVSSITLLGAGAGAQTLGAFTYAPDPIVAVTPAVSEEKPLAAVVPSSFASGFFGTSRLLDLNGDGKADRCIFQSTTSGGGPTLGTHSVCALGDGDGSFGAPIYDALATIGVLGDPHVVDIDGDGRADVCWADGVGNTQCAISNGGGTFDAIKTDLHAGDWTGAPWTSRFGDINGDGKVDYCAVRDSSIRCALGTGAGVFQTILGRTTAVSLTPTESTVVLRDIDGDGLADLCSANELTATVTCLRSLGNGTFGTPVTTTLSATDPQRVVFADLNGDGVTDVCGRKMGKNANGEIVDLGTTTVTCALGRGDGGFEAPVSKLLHGSSGLAGYRMVAADVSGDGADDLCFTDTGSTGMLMWCTTSMRTGTFGALYYLPAVLGDLSTYDEKVELADLDGDGSTDFCAMRSGTVMGAKCVLSKSVRPNIMLTRTDELGGKKTLTYGSARMAPATKLPLGMSFSTLAKVTLNDGRSNVVSSFPIAYEGGLWSFAENRFLGFRKTTETLDAAGTKRETVRSQTLFGRGVPLSVHRKNAAGAIYDYTTYIYDESLRAPLLTETLAYECNLTSTCRAKQTQYAYNAYGEVTLRKDYGDTVVNGDAHVVEYGYVPNATKYIVNKLGLERTFTGVDIATGTLLRRIEHLYDGATAYNVAPTTGDETQTRVWNSVDGGYLVTTRSYDALGNVTSSRNPRGTLTTTEWDATGLFPSKVCAVLNATQSLCKTMTWDPKHERKTSEIDANLRKTSFAYDFFGRPTVTTYPNAGTLTKAYVSIGVPTAQYVETRTSDGSADGLFKRRYIDGLGRNYKTTRDLTYTQLNTFAPDVPSRLVQASYWFASNETPKYEVYEYDAAGRRTRTTHVDQTFTRTDYGVGSRTDYNESGVPKTTIDDVRGLVTTVRELDGSVNVDTKYAYDALGRLVGITDADGHASSRSYDSLDRLSQACNPDSGCTKFAYNAAGSLSGTTDAAGQIVTHTYDALERRISKMHPGGKKWQWFYDEPGHGDSQGRVTRHTFPIGTGTASGSDETTYDAMGHITSEKMCRDTLCFTMGYTFDTAGEGRLKSVVYPDETVSYTYDAAGRIATVGIGYASAFSYNARDALLSVTFGNTLVETNQQHPELFRLSKTTVKKGSIQLYDEAITYHQHRLISRTAHTYGPPGATAQVDDLSFDYDDRDRLRSVSDGTAAIQTLTYSASGNITSNSLLGDYIYGDASHKHAVTKAGSLLYTYDANGNMKSGDGRTLSWDAENRLVKITKGSVTTNSDYDGNGMRVRKTTPSETTTYFGRYLEHDGTSLIKYIFADDRRVARRIGTGAKFYFHQDHLGSVRLITDAAGKEVRRYNYSPFGSDYRPSSGTDLASNDLRFTGHRSDDESSLVYMNARYYDPKLARFLSADSIVPNMFESQDHSRYSYVRNNPVGYLDPTGHGPVQGGYGGGQGAGDPVGTSNPGNGGGAGRAANNSNNANPANHARPSGEAKNTTADASSSITRSEWRDILDTRRKHYDNDWVDAYDKVRDLYGWSDDDKIEHATAVADAAQQTRDRAIRDRIAKADAAAKAAAAAPKPKSTLPGIPSEPYLEKTWKDYVDEQITTNPNDDMVRNPPNANMDDDISHPAPGFHFNSQHDI